MARPLPLLHRLTAFLFALALCGFQGAQAAPEFLLGGHAEELAGVTLADMPGLGPVSSLDLLFFDARSGNTLALVPVEALLEPGSLAAEPWLAEIRGALLRLATLQVIGQESAADWTPDPRLQRVLAYDGAAAAWIETVIGPGIVIEPADIHRYYIANPQHYLQRRRIDVRYIFSRLPEDATPDARQAARQELEAIAARVRAGEVAFADAARASSDAPSARDGGEVPSFYDGTYFPGFEQAILALGEPGLTPVFEGPGGLYLVQVVSVSPPANIPFPGVQEEIAERLRHEHVGPWFTAALAELTLRSVVIDYSPNYSYLDLDAPLARVGKATLDRPLFFLAYGDPVQADYSVDGALVFNSVQHWIAGETIMQELERLGLAGHPFIARSMLFGAIAPRADEALRRTIDATAFDTPEKALAWLRSDPVAAANQRAVRLVQLQFSPKVEDEDPAPAAAELAAQRLIRDLNGQISGGRFPTEPTPIELAPWLAARTAAGDSVDAITDALRLAIAGTVFPNTLVNTIDLKWIDVVPGSIWDRVLRDVEPGEVSPPEPFGNLTRRFIVVAKRPLDLEPLTKRPLQVELLAWRASVEQALAEARDRVRPTIGFHVQQPAEGITPQ